VPDTSAPPHQRRLRPIVALAAVLVAVAVAAAVAASVWVHRTDAALAGVRVLPRSMHCGVHEMPYVLSADDPAETMPFIGFDVTIRPDSTCQLEVTFVNDGPSTVHVDTATFWGMGTGEAGFSLFEVTQNGGRFNATDTGTDPESGDAVLPIDEELGRDESFTQLFDMRVRRSAFTGQPDVLNGYNHVPTVQVSHGGRGRDVESSVDLRIRQKP
jgi:hypothetical protein